MKNFWMLVAVAIMLIGLSTALPNDIVLALGKLPDTTQPKNTMMGQSLKDLGIEVCPDNLHLCPGTAECCQKENETWDCCPKAIFNFEYECCKMFGFLSVCCTPIAPKCHVWGCWWS